MDGRKLEPEILPKIIITNLLKSILIFVSVNLKIIITNLLQTIELILMGLTMFYWAPLINFLVLPLMESLAPGCSSCLINKHKRKYEKKFFSHVFSSQNLKFQNQALSTWTRSPRGRKSTCKIRYQFFVSSTKKNNASFSFGKKNAWALA